VRAGTRGGKVFIRRQIRATRQELFDAWTDPEGMREWMCQEISFPPMFK
jgi:uncharacterized protein YndB with AHSA1/START domain